MGEGARVGAIEFHFFGKNVTQVESGGTIAIFSRVLEKESAAGLRGLLIDVGEAMRTVASEKLEAEQSVVREFLLPRSAGSGEAGLLKMLRRQRELADDRAGSDDVASGAVERIDLLLIESLADEREIQRNVVDAPVQGNF